MGFRILHIAAAIGVAALSFTGCGGRARSSVAAATAAGGAGVAGGSTLVTTPAAGAGAANAAGAAGSPDTQTGELPVPAIDIAGRWAMFHFEDPVGIQVTEDDAGALTGRGCASGTPPLESPQSSPGYCGDVHGTVQANRAHFEFAFMGYDYIAETTVSADGQRMTGRFHGAVDWLAYPTAWLRVPDGAPGLPHSRSLDNPAGAGRMI